LRRALGLLSRLMRVTMSLAGNDAWGVTLRDGRAGLQRSDLARAGCHEFLKHLANASRSDATSFDGPFSHLRWTCLSTLRGKFLFCGKPEPKS